MPAANLLISAPRQFMRARYAAAGIIAGIAALTAASFWSLELQWAIFFSADSARRMSKFLGELLAPSGDAAFLGRVVAGSLETLAMSALGTLLAAIGGLALALPASRSYAADGSLARAPVRLVLNVLRSIPELVWAALLLISAGLGPFAGTLALAMHTTGVLGRLFAEAVENASPAPSSALRVQGVPAGRVFLYATLPQVLPQVLSYTLYRWENNIRAATVLGVVGAGGLGQLLMFHMGLFHMRETSTVLIAMILLVSLVDFLSYVMRRMLAR
jgi:phosphonate transport system permease protein